MKGDKSPEYYKEEADRETISMYKTLSGLQVAIDNAMGGLSEMAVLGEKIDHISKGQDEMKKDIKEIKEQTQKTNGRVTKLETWQETMVRWIPKTIGGLVVLIGVIGYLVSYIYENDKDRFKADMVSLINEHEAKPIEFDI